MVAVIASKREYSKCIKSLEDHLTALVFNQFVPEHEFPEDSSKVFVVITLEDLNELESQSITPDLTRFIDECLLIHTEVNLPEPNDATRTIPSVIFSGYTD